MLKDQHLKNDNTNSIITSPLRHYENDPEMTDGAMSEIQDENTQEIGQNYASYQNSERDEQIHHQLVGS